MNEYLNMWKRGLDFSGRSRRREFWIPAFLNFIFILIGTELMPLIENYVGFDCAWVLGLYVLALIIPSIALMVRRLHDTGRSGIWYLIKFIPVIGSLLLIGFSCIDSTEDNEYGPNIKW